MQVPASSAAAQAGGIVSQGTAKDKNSSTGVTPSDTPTNPNAHVEQSGTSNPDRDAQGQGDGLGPRPGKIEDQTDIAGQAAEESTSSPGNDEPPSLLDVIA